MLYFQWEVLSFGMAILSWKDPGHAHIREAAVPVRPCDKHSIFVRLSLKDVKNCEHHGAAGDDAGLTRRDVKQKRMYVRALTAEQQVRWKCRQLCRWHRH